MSAPRPRAYRGNGHRRPTYLLAMIGAALLAALFLVTMWACLIMLTWEVK